MIPNWTATKELLEIGKVRFQESPKCINILFMEWIDKEKGVFELLDAIKALVQRPEKARVSLCMLGEGAAFAEVNAYVKSNSLQQYVRLPGWINAARKVSYFRDAHIFVLPSYMEGMPNAVIEAMASGLPVVATNVGAVSEMIQTGENGIVINPRSWQEIFSALELLMGDAGLRYKLGQAAWKDASKKYNADQAVDSLIRIATEVVNR